MIRRLLPVRDVLAPKQLPPETAQLLNNSDPFWALPMLADAYAEPTRSALRWREPVSFGGCLIAAIVIGVMGLAFFLILSLLGIGVGKPSSPIDLSGVVPVFFTVMMRVGVPLFLAAFLALTGLAAHKVWSVKSR
jgi:hypothetical protein